MARKQALDKLLTEIRSEAPAKTIQTQLCPGVTDFVPWMKIAIPHGNGCYVQIDLSDIDPNYTAPPLATKDNILTDVAHTIINDGVYKLKI